MTDNFHRQHEGDMFVDMLAVELNCAENHRFFFHQRCHKNQLNNKVSTGFE